MRHDPESIRRLLLDCGFHDAPWPPRGARRYSVVGRPLGDGPCEIIVGCVAEGDAFHLRVSPAGAREWVTDMLEQNGVRGVKVRAEPVPGEEGARGPWLAVTAGIGAIVLFTLSLLS
jgi:hypothetical protein